mmetsp:Transcript_46518/g.69245  ORF Transcript_46518/g.69245 Transcript_46518/m.69245 type:complete len:299 (+) Transcript_46518:1669-2565(+)
MSNTRVRNSNTRVIINRFAPRHPMVVACGQTMFLALMATVAFPSDAVLEIVRATRNPGCRNVRRRCWDCWCWIRWSWHRRSRDAVWVFPCSIACITLILGVVTPVVGRLRTEFVPVPSTARIRDATRIRFNWRGCGRSRRNNGRLCWLHRNGRGRRFGRVCGCDGNLSAVPKLLRIVVARFEATSFVRDETLRHSRLSIGFHGQPVTNRPAKVSIVTGWKATVCRDVMPTKQDFIARHSHRKLEFHRVRVSDSTALQVSTLGVVYILGHAIQLIAHKLEKVVRILKTLPSGARTQWTD